MTTPNPFAQPDKGDRFTPRDHPEWVGRLFLFYPDSVSQQMGTNAQGQPEPYESVEADIVIVDLVSQETGQPTVLRSARVGGKALVPQIKKHCGGGMVLGRLAQTAAQGQKSGAFYLADYSDADVQVATQYINAHPRNAFTQPTAQAAPAAAPQQQYGQQPPTNVTQMPGYGGPQAQAQAQYASQTLPYDPWQGTQAAAQAAPAGPPQGQWGAPAGSPQAAPAQSAPASASAPWGQPAANAPAPAAAPAAAPPQSAPGEPPLDPGLVAFLQSKGVNPEGMSDGQARMIAATYS